MLLVPKLGCDVRYGSIADRKLIQHVRLLADFGRDGMLGLGPRCARSGHSHHNHTSTICGSSSAIQLNQAGVQTLQNVSHVP